MGTVSVQGGPIGAGGIGFFHGESIASRIPGATLASVADPAPGVAERLDASLGCPHATPQPAEFPHARMMLDLYHAQIGEGNLIAPVERADGAIGEAQVADVAGRCEPGTGEIYYPVVARALRRAGYAGTVGLEAYASGDDTESLARYSAAFSHELRGDGDRIGKGAQV